MVDKPMEFLKEEMESDQIAIRVNAIHRTPIIGALIGERGIEKELLPYFETLVSREDDEVVYAIARQLGKL